MVDLSGVVVVNSWAGKKLMANAVKSDRTQNACGIVLRKKVSESEKKKPNHMW